MLNSKTRKASILKQSKGALLVESAFIIPIFLMLIFCIFEVYRMRAVQMMLESIATNIAFDLSSRDLDTVRIDSIIRNSAKRASMRFIDVNNYDQQLRYYITAFSEHSDFASYTDPVQWPSKQGEIITRGTGAGTGTGNTILVTVVYKFDFLTYMTQELFTAMKEGDGKGYLLLSECHVIRK